MIVPARYVRKDARVYHFSHCLCCGSSYGIGQGEPKACRVTRCLACGTEQCMVNGLSSGQCSVCFAGLLDGWSGSHFGQPCSYKGCAEAGVARGRGRKVVCLAHLERQQPKWKEGYAARLKDFFHLVGPMEVPAL